MAVFITWIPCSCFNKTAHEIWGVGKNHLVLCILITYTLFFFYKNIFYKNIEAEICEILRIF